MSECSVQWFGGATVDHIYENCPAYKRGRAAMEACGWDRIGGDDLDPHGTDVCGLCLHRHNRADHPTPTPSHATDTQAKEDT